MPFKKLVYMPGVNTQATQTMNESGYSFSNLVRWLNGGYLQKYGGWQRLTGSTFAGLIRSMHAYEDLSGVSNLLLGTDGGSQLYADGSIFNLKRSEKTVVLAGSGVLVPTSGTTTVTVTDNGHGRTVGSQAYISIAYSLGGTVIYPQTVTITSVTTNTWTFSYSQTFSSTDSFGVPTFNAQTVGSSIITVQLSAHGLSVGDSFQVNWDVVYTATAGVPNAVTQAGTYTVLSVPNSSTFTIDCGTLANALATGYQYTLASAEVIAYIGLPPATPQNWFTDNLGQNGLVSFTGSPIYEYIPPIPAGGDVVLYPIATGPQINTGMMVAMPQAQIIAFGSESIIGGGVQDPLLLRWSDAGNSDVWVADATNQAGSYRLSRGSRIIGGIQAPQSTLIFTDVDVWSMSYIGGQLVYSFLVMGSGCGLVSANARAVVGRTTYWMSQKSFWTYGDNGVQPINCDVYDKVFGDLDTANVGKCFAGANSAFNEILFFYPSLSGGTGEVDSYVKLNTLSGKWDYGSLGRTAYIDESIFGTPLAADLDCRVQKQETGYDADTAAMTGAFAETGFAEIADGENLMFVDLVIPDFNWLGTDGFVEMTIYGCNFPGETPRKYGPYTVTPETRMISVRLRHRLVAFRWEWGDASGFNARIGAPMVRFAPAGRQ